MLGCVMKTLTLRTKKRINSGLFVAALLGMTAHAAQANEPNVFNADLTHPDLALAVSAFEETCMPFVLHETEMDREHDKQHMAKLMQSRGFTYMASKPTENERYLVAPAPTYWEQNSRPDFTVFYNVSDQVVLSTKTVVSRSRNTARNSSKAKYVGIVRHIQTYSDENYPRLSVDITWNYPTQKDPGKQCEISVSQTAISRSDFTESFIAKDADWVAKADRSTIAPLSWSQCVKDGEDGFAFKVSHEDDTVKISMRRSDFYESKLCGANKIYSNETAHAQ